MKRQDKTTEEKILSSGNKRGCVFGDLSRRFVLVSFLFLGNTTQTRLPREVARAAIRLYEFVMETKGQFHTAEI